jgi:putative phosphoesterase
VRIAVVSDVHGNLTALEAVVADLARRGPDLVVHGGDLALMGPRPEEVIDFVRTLAWPGVVGNTDQLLWRPEEHARQRDRAPALRVHLDLLFDVYAPDTLARLGDERVSWLRELPSEYRVGELTVLHAQPDDLWRAPLPDASEEEFLAAYPMMDTAQVAYGHIHRPFARRAGSLGIANAGSVGLPWDGDPRASYLLVTAGVAEIIRVAYDIEAEVAALQAAGHPDSGRLAEMRRRGRFIRPEPHLR